MRFGDFDEVIENDDTKVRRSCAAGDIWDAAVLCPRGYAF